MRAREDSLMLALTVLALSLVVRIYDNVGVSAAEMASARAAAEAITSRRRDPIRVWSLQELHTPAPANAQS